MIRMAEISFKIKLPPPLQNIEQFGCKDYNNMNMLHRALKSLSSKMITYNIYETIRHISDSLFSLEREREMVELGYTEIIQ